jgi:hypothetical protein
MLYWAAREDFTGQGQIIDAGAFLGASAYALARGIADRRDGKTPGPIWVHSYDYFYVVDDYVGAFIADQIRPVEPGASYLDLFQQQLGTLADRVRPYAGDMLTHEWNGSPIEILFIDIAKTKELNSHIIRQFFPRLIPGKSIVIQQDFYHAWHPYIHVTMQVLKKYFEIIDPYCPYQSRVYRSVGAIPPDELERVARYDYDPEQCYRLLAELATESEPPVQQMARLLRLYHMVLNRDWPRFATEWRTFERECDLASPELWATEAKRVLGATPFAAEWAVVGGSSRVA